MLDFKMLGNMIGAQKPTKQNSMSLNSLAMYTRSLFIGCSRYLEALIARTAPEVGPNPLRGLLLLGDVVALP